MNHTTTDRSMVIGLVSCSKRKLSFPAPARLLYTGHAFQMSKQYVEAHCDQWLVLSAEHGVVDPDQEIGPYDKTLSKMKKHERDEWGRRVRLELDDRFRGRNVKYIVLAGAPYAEPLKGMNVDLPLRGMTQGTRLQWLRRNTRGPEIVICREKQSFEGRNLRYFLPDSHDCVDPTFNFKSETRSSSRVRHRDDLYVHEIFGQRVIDGILLSMGFVQPVNEGGSSFSQSQRLRLAREGARAFYRLGSEMETMGDCGAFAYVDHETPPVSVDDVITFYDSCKFDYGISVDHIIKEFNPRWDLSGDIPSGVKRRKDQTIELAHEFWKRSSGERFVPMGVAQGWSPNSLASSVTELQKIGYTYIAIGGLVPLKNKSLIEALRAVSSVRRPGTRFHLLGVARPELHSFFSDLGAASCDSTSPIRQAFMDRKNNYHVCGDTYAAIRIPQVGGNPKLKKLIASGEVDQDHACRLERRALEAMEDFDRGRLSTAKVLCALTEYDEIHSPGSVRKEIYRRTLDASPWKQCPCDVCTSIGHHVILFRGAERNRRRGFHNVWNFYNQINAQRSP